VYASLEEFTAAVARLAQLDANGQLRIKVFPGGGVALRMDQAAEHVPPWGGGLYMDIYDVLDAVANRVAVEDFIAVRSVAGGPDSRPAEEEHVSRAKYEATAAAFPPRRLKAGLWQRLRARGRAALAWALIAFGKRTRQLGRMMGWYPVRRILGPAGRRAAWRALGAQVADTSYIGPRVWLRIPKRVSIGAGSKLGGRIMIESYGEVTIGRNVLINDTDVFSTQHDIDHPHFKGDRQFVSIGDYAWLPHKIIVLPGVRIGSHAVIGTGSVVSSDVPDYGVAVGNPARVVKERARIHYTYVPSTIHRAPKID
jgi:acetyltransferase-like isoleucine patch superfamily enzyme